MSQNMTRNGQQEKRRKKTTTRLTLEVLQQLGIALAQPCRLLGDLLKLVGDLGELAAGRR
jgi:hypothetical protein